MSRVLGADLGGSKLLVCLTDQHGRILARATRPTGRNTGPEAAVRLIAEAAREVQGSAGRLDRVGVGFPGLVDHDRGVARSSVMLDGWRDVPLAVLLARALDAPCVVDNDVNAAAYAELACRRADGPDSMLFVAIGTGIGGAIALGGQLWRGSTGIAGEIGNTTIERRGPRCWCGRRGCLNVFASGSAIERHLRLPPGATLRERLETGDRRAAAAVARAAGAVGIAIANALNLLNPALVVLGGGLAGLGADFLDAVAATARAEAFAEADCRFEVARAGYEAAAVGSALLALAAQGSTTSAARAARGAATARGEPPPCAGPRPGPSSDPRARRRAPRRSRPGAAR